MEQVEVEEIEQCLHCGSSLDGPLVQRYSSFCSDGCRVIYHNIHDLGLEDYYQHCRARGYSPSIPSVPTPEKFEIFDRRNIQKGIVERHGAIHTATLFLEGTEGPASAWLIEKLPTAVPGMFTSSINLATGVARFSYYPEKVSLSKILQAVNELGFIPRKPHTRSALAAEVESDRVLLKRIFATGSGSLVLIMLTSLLQSEGTAGEVPLGIVIPVIALALTFYTAPVLLKECPKTPPMLGIRPDILPILAFSGLLFWNLGLSISGLLEQTYYDLYATLLFLVCVLHWSTQRMLIRALRQVRLALLSFSPLVRVKQEDFIREAPIEAIRSGQEILVGAGEYFPADGVVSEGSSLVDTTRWDGIRDLHPIRAGSTVIAGTLNIKSSVTVRVKSIGEATRINKVVAQLEEPKQEALTLRNARIAQTLFSIAMLGGLSYFVIASPKGISPEHVLWALLAVAPINTSIVPFLCATIGLGKASKTGLFFRDAHALDTLARTKSFYLDKSSVLCSGIPFVLHAEYYCPKDDIPELQKLLASIVESTPFHPLSLAIKRWLSFGDSLSDSSVVPLDCYVLPGRGFVYETESDRWMFGSQQWLEDSGLVTDSFLSKVKSRSFRSKTSTLILAKNKELMASFEVLSTPKQFLGSALRVLRAWGKRSLKCLSSDDEEATQAVLEGFRSQFHEIKGGLYREELLRRLRRDRMISAFVGDARYERDKMESVELGISVTHGVKSLLDRCGLFIQSGDLDSLNSAVKLAYNTTGRIWRMIILSCLFHFSAATIALCGWIGPVGAALLMVVGSYSVFSLTIASIATRRGLFFDEHYFALKSSDNLPDSWRSNTISEPPINEPFM